jgi:hypothetical protein
MRYRNIFGTARFAQKGERPEVGVPGVQEPKSVSDFLFMPFKKRERTIPATRNAPGGEADAASGSI